VTPLSDAGVKSRGAHHHPRLHVVATLLAVAIVPTLAWALWPSGPPDLPRVRDPETTSTAAVTPASFDADAFSTPIWVAAPLPPSPPETERESPPPPPPEPLKVQLLSIVREGDTRRAMLFDPDTRKVVTLAVGDRVGSPADGRTIASITDKEVILSGPPPHTSQTLSLRDPATLPPSTTKPRKRP
jgi:hypothetical protein